MPDDYFATTCASTSQLWIADGTRRVKVFGGGTSDATAPFGQVTVGSYLTSVTRSSTAAPNPTSCGRLPKAWRAIDPRPNRGFPVHPDESRCESRFRVIEMADAS